MGSDQEGANVTHSSARGRLDEGGGPFPEDPYREELSLLQILEVLVRHRYLIGTSAMAFAVAVAGISLLSPRTYSVESAFFPQATQTGRAVGLARIAGQFGIGVPGGDATQSPGFYANLLRTREILTRVAYDTFTASKSGWRGDTVRVVGTLPELLDIAEEDTLRQGEAALKWLREKAVSSWVSHDTGIVTLWVVTPWPTVSMDISLKLLELVHEFNLTTRRTQAAAEREFIEQREAIAIDELAEAEGELKDFLEANRQFENSPHLRFEHDRMEREVSRRQQLLNSLVQALEEARIMEVRNTPLITVVDHPNEPVTGDRRGTPLKALLGLCVGTGLGILLAFGREFMLWSREQGGEDYVRFRGHWEDAVADLRGFFRGRRG